MRIRPYHESDIAELTDLVNEAQRESYEFIARTERDVQERLSGASCVLLAIDEEDSIAGLAYLRQDWYGETLTLSVRWGRSQDEIADLLLPIIEPQNKTGVVSTSIEPQNQARLALFTSRGYTRESSLYQLIARLDHPLAPPQVAAGYVVRSLSPDEEEAFIRLANASYEGERLRPGILARWKEGDPTFDSDLIQVAEYEGQLVALVAARSDLAYNRHYGGRRGYLGPAGTLPTHRGNNLSKALTARAMNLLRERGMQTACLHTWDKNPSALAVATSLGFRVEHEFIILHKTFDQVGMRRAS
ncbi:MAG: GNAT family N-acetyltransferase [Dehalococcoidia bacterium]